MSKEALDSRGNEGGGGEEDERRASLPKVLLGMAVLNRVDKLPKTLEAITRLDYPAELLRLVFVDGDSTDGTFELLKEFEAKNRGNFREVLVSRGEFRKLPSSLNYALSQLEDEEYFLRLDSDVILQPDSLSSLLELSSKGYDICMLGQKEQKGEDLSQVEKKTRETSKIEEVDNSGMSCVLISPRAIKEVGGFDERLVWLPEDDDYCYRARAKGMKIAIDREHFVSHQMENRKPRFGWRRWTYSQRRSTAFNLIKIIQYGPSKLPRGRNWLLRMVIYFLIFLSTILSPLLGWEFFIPILAFFVFRLARTESLKSSLIDCLVVIILFPITVFALAEVGLELKSARFRIWRNRRIIGLNEP